MAGPPDSRPPPAPSRLLCVSPHIRYLIYHYLGLVSWEARRYKFDLHGRRAWFDVPDSSCFHGLLLSCRAIHAEAAALLYSANRFVLYYSHADPASLRPLLALTTPALRALSNLKVVLNEASCHQLAIYPGSDGCCLYGRKDDRLSGAYFCKRDHDGLHQLPLLSPDSEGSDNDRLAAAQTLVSKWHAAAARLSQIAPGRLALSLVCDIDPRHPQALDIAKAVVGPIRHLHLRECHIRLAKVTDGRLQQLAQDTVFQTCGIPALPWKPSNTTTLASLPREVRIRILEYTDLVTPRKQVIWSRQDRGYMIFTYECIDNGTPEDNHAAQFFRCWHGTSLIGGPPTTGCYCRSHHAAYSLNCRCWAPPRPLFLICRTLYDDAQFVFFSSNRFIIHDFKISPPWALPLHKERPRDRSDWFEEPGQDVLTYPYPNARLAVSHFVREVVPASSLAHLRFLELVFPPYQPASWPDTQHPAMQDWRATVDWLRGKINASALTVRVVVVKAPFISSNAYRATITTQEGDRMMQAWMDLLQPLRRLGENGGSGLGRFYARFPYPWERTEESRLRQLESRGLLEMMWLPIEEGLVKERAERYVLGSRYEKPFADGAREEPAPSDWNEMFDDYY